MLAQLDVARTALLEDLADLEQSLEPQEAVELGIERSLVWFITVSFGSCLP